MAELFTQGREILPGVLAPTRECAISFAVVESKLFVYFRKGLDDALGHFDNPIRFTVKVGDDGLIARLGQWIFIRFHFPDQSAGGRLDARLNELGAGFRDFRRIAEIPNAVSFG